jgi:hypothetical protein
VRSVLAGLRTLVLPWGATITPRIVLGPDVPPVLGAYEPLPGFDTTWSAAALWYFNATDYYFIASGHIVIPGPPADVDFVAKGVYRADDGFNPEVVVIHELLTSDTLAQSVYYGDATTALVFSYSNCTISVADDGSTIRFAGRGLEISRDTVKAGDPNSVVDAVETWHNAALVSGWVNRAGGYPAVQYQKVASPPNSVQISGQMKNGLIANGTTITTLPVGYRPTSPQAVTISSGGGGNAGGQLEVATTGVVRCFDLPAGTTIVAINGCFPLDTAPVP